MPVLLWQHESIKESRALYGEIAIIDPAEKTLFPAAMDTGWWQGLLIKR
ncbi:hypothetical protein [Bacillus salipaludis]|uniref:Uncharacterized protein n=1 Tax=Bacillus salipaludis TaxID=2547811 RepID=A0AA90QTX3_9BACI|nr:hypothetical protein [Bacillus salipaludis]MDQ6594848.1 hypothetical protein [Bacillus salipaludis]